MKVAATVGMVADIVREVAGNKATVKNIIGSGVDPHVYNPTRGDVAILLKSGYHLLCRIVAGGPDV